jgi:hypothetical protein
MRFGEDGLQRPGPAQAILSSAATIVDEARIVIIITLMAMQRGANQWIYWQSPQLFWVSTCMRMSTCMRTSL